MKDFPPEGLGDSFAALGLKAAFIIAGFAGGISSLWYLHGLNRKQALLAIFISVACATYGTPVVIHILGITDVNMSYFAAYALGLSAMNIVPLVRLAASRAMRDKVNALVPDQPTQGDGGKAP